MRPNLRAAPLGAPAEPWASFLRELDELLEAAVELHCLGGFVVTQHCDDFTGEHRQPLRFRDSAPRLPE